MKATVRIAFVLLIATLLRESSGYAALGLFSQQRWSLPTPTTLRSVTKHDASNFAPFPDSTRIILGKSVSSNNNVEYRVDMSTKGDKPPAPEQLWNWWSEKSVHEDALKGAIAKGKTGAELKPVFDEYSKYLVQDKVEVLNANRHYFEALRSGDMGAMQALWLNSNSTVCVTNSYFKGHLESANVIGGYANISNYYAKHTPTLLDYQLEDINLLYYGDVAVVSCSVHAHKPSQHKRTSARARTALSTAPALSYYVTNVFQRPFGSDRYFLHTHVSSLSPVGASSSAAGTSSGRSGGADGARRRRISAAQRATYKDPTRAVRAPSRREGFPLEQLGRFFGRNRRASGSDTDADGYGSDTESEEESEEERVDDITGEYFDAEDDEDPDDEEGEYDNDAGDDEGENETDHLVVMTEEGPQRARRFTGSKGSGGGFNSANNKNAARDSGRGGVPSPAEEESQLRMNRLKDAILRTLSSLATQRGGSGMAGLRNGVFIVSSNGPTVVPPISAAASPTDTAVPAPASDATNPSNPLRALDAVMRGLPPSSLSQPPVSASVGAVGGGGHTRSDAADHTREIAGGGDHAETNQDREHQQEQEQEQAVMKALAARSLEALRHLHAAHQLSREEKTVLSSDVIQCLSQGSYSQVEMAYALLILGARPDESVLRDDLVSLSSSTSDLSDAFPEDVADFAAFCHSFAQQLAA